MRSRLFSYFHEMMQCARVRGRATMAICFSALSLDGVSFYAASKNKHTKIISSSMADEWTPNDAMFSLDSNELVGQLKTRNTIGSSLNVSEISNVTIFILKNICELIYTTKVLIAKR